MAFSGYRIFTVLNLIQMSFDLHIDIQEPYNWSDSSDNWIKLETELEQALAENRCNTPNPNIDGKFNISPQAVVEYKVIYNTRKIECVVKRIDGATST